MTTIKKPIPNHLFIKGMRISVKYEGSEKRPKMCYGCRKTGHIASECERFTQAELVNTEIFDYTETVETTILDDSQTIAKEPEESFDQSFSTLLRNTTVNTNDQSAVCMDQTDVVESVEGQKENSMEVGIDETELEEGEIDEASLLEEVKNIRKRTLSGKKKIKMRERERERKAAINKTNKQKYNYS